MDGQLMPNVNNQSWDQEGNLLEDVWIDVLHPALSGYQVIAALNAALGLWSLTDAANAANVTVEHLIAEVEAWGYVAATTE